MTQALIIDAGPPPGQLRNLFTSEHRCDSGARGSIADAHFTGTKDIDLGGKHIGDLDAGLHRHDRMRSTHSRTVHHIGRTPANFLGKNLTVTNQFSKIIPCPDIDHAHSGPGLTGQSIDARSSPDEIMDHLGGDLGRILRHTLGRDPMITDHDHHLFTGDQWLL